MNFITTTPIQSSKMEIPTEILDDLASRFLINIPDSEKDEIRFFFIIEQAHWFYLDFYCAESDKLQPCGIKQFAYKILNHIPAFKKYLNSVDKILDEWRKYKSSVPTYGAILLTEDLNHILLVQSFFAKNSWGFPKGKRNQEEDPVRSAAREVDEETSFDCSKLISPNDYLEANINYQYIRLYIVRGVPFDTKFEPKCRNEIKECAWFKVDELPSSRSDNPVMKGTRKIRANSFYMIIPFLNDLKKWIYDAKHNRNMKGKSNRKNPQKQGSSSPFFANNLDQNRSRQRHKSLGDSEYFAAHQENNQKQPYTSTPINQTSLLQSTSSAFRIASNENSKSNNNKKKNRSLAQHPAFTNYNANNNNGYQFQQQQQAPPPQQDHIKRKLFSDVKETNTTGIKPLYISHDGLPAAWKNFTFDKERMLAAISH